MKVYVVLSGYHDPEGGGDQLEGIFSDFDKAEQFVLNVIELDKERKYPDCRGWNMYSRNSIDNWSIDSYMSSEGVSIEEIEVQ